MKNCASAHPASRAARGARTSRPPSSAPLAHPLPPAPQRVRLRAARRAQRRARGRAARRVGRAQRRRRRGAVVLGGRRLPPPPDLHSDWRRVSRDRRAPRLGGGRVVLDPALLLLRDHAVHDLPEAHVPAARRPVRRPLLLLAVRAVLDRRQLPRVQGEVVGVRRRREAAGAAGAGAALRLADQDARVARRQGDHQLVRRVQGAGADVPQEEDDAALAQDRRPHGAHRRGDAHRVLLHRAPPQEWHRRLHPLQIRARPLGGGGDGVAPPPQADDPPRGAGPPPLDAQGAPASADAPAHPADAPSGRPAPRARRRRRARRPEPSAPRPRHDRCAPSCGSSGTASPSTRR